VKLTCTDWKKIPSKFVRNIYIMGIALSIFLTFLFAGPFLVTLETGELKYLWAYVYWIFLYFVLESEKEDCEG
jgi:Ca2+/Na+ antiporter